MDLETISRLVGNLGFPIFVATWLLVRLEPALHDLTIAIRDNTKETAEHRKDVGRLLVAFGLERHNPGGSDG